MMTQFRKRRFAVLRLGAAIPVVAAMMMLCSFTVKTPLPAAGDPDRPTVTVHISSGGKILFNGRPVTVGDLERLIAAEREKLSEADRAQMEVVLRADKDAPMADLADVMDASRRAHAFRLKLTAEASDPGIVRMLPPDPLRLSADSKVKVLVPDQTGNMGTLRIEERNLFVVRVDVSGTVIAGVASGPQSVSDRELPGLIKSFVLNAADDPGMAEKTLTEIALPDGRTMNYPVSEGIVSLQVSPGASFGRYLEVQRLIARAFDSIRDDLSQRQFGADYALLDEPQRQVIARAVPLKLTEPRR